MKTRILLEKLIDIAQLAKTDFALGMNLTPSGLSKILGGTRQSHFKEKSSFSRQAASYFSENLYGYNCYLKFEDLFPVIYDFNSKCELETFLACAIEYALDMDFITENNGQATCCDMEQGFLGKKAILNMICILLSDQIINYDGDSLEFYSTLPIFTDTCSDIFYRIKFLPPKNRKHITVNHFYDHASMEAAWTKHGIKLLIALTKVHQHFDLELWKSGREITSAFLLLKNRLLLVFSFQLDGTPLLTLIERRSYLLSFFDSLMKRDIQKISYTSAEVCALLDAGSPVFDKLIRTGIDSVYDFMSVGYLLEMDKLDKLSGNDTTKSSMFRLFQSVLTTETTFSITLAAMTEFCSTGKISVPLLGTVYFTPRERIPYLRQFSLYLSKESNSKIRLINYELTDIVVLCSKGINIVYICANKYISEKIYYFKTSMIQSVLEREISEGHLKTTAFCTNLWEAYMEDMTKQIRL